jgi:hypothetical protein
MGAVPVHVPGEAVSVWPTAAVPLTVGGELDAGAVTAGGAGAGAVTTPVGSELDVADPVVLLAVTATRTVSPTAVLVTGNVAVSEPEAAHDPPVLLHNIQW